MLNINENDKFILNTSTWYSVGIINWNREKWLRLINDNSFLNKLKEVSDFRWKVLSISTSIEILINANIELIIFDEQNENSKLFQDLFLRTNYLTFFSKWNIFKELCKSSNKVKKNYDKKIISTIQGVIETRNNLAHWYLIYDYLDKNFYIEYYKRSNIQTDLISEKYIKSSLNELYNCINDINILIYWKDTTIKKTNLK